MFNIILTVRQSMLCLFSSMPFIPFILLHYNSFRTVIVAIPLGAFIRFFSLLDDGVGFIDAHVVDCLGNGCNYPREMAQCKHDSQ